MATDRQRLKVTSVRVDEEKLQLAAVHKIDLGQLFRKALEEEIAKREGKCHACGQKIKWELMK